MSWYAEARQGWWDGMIGSLLSKPKIAWAGRGPGGLRGSAFACSAESTTRQCEAAADVVEHNKLMFGCTCGGCATQRDLDQAAAQD